MKTACDHIILCQTIGKEKILFLRKDFAQLQNNPNYLGLKHLQKDMESTFGTKVLEFFVPV